MHSVAAGPRPAATAITERLGGARGYNPRGPGQA
jgi:hypothetical protein